jgi:hypothetical protein
MNEADQHDRIAAGHETSAIAMRAVAWSGIGLVATIVVSLVLVWELLSMFSQQEKVAADSGTTDTVRAMQPSRLPDAPELEVNQAVALGQLRSRERALLDEYAWLDRQAGIARIPIERAIEIVSQNGLPKTSGTAAPVGGQTQ